MKPPSLPAILCLLVTLPLLAVAPTPSTNEEKLIACAWVSILFMFAAVFFTLDHNRK